MGLSRKKCERLAHGSASEQLEVLGFSGCPTDLVNFLASSGDSYYVRAMAVQHPNVSEEVLKGKVMSRRYADLINVYTNPHLTSQFLIWSLTQFTALDVVEMSPDFRGALARVLKHRNCPAYVNLDYVEEYAPYRVSVCLRSDRFPVSQPSEGVPVNISVTLEDMGGGRLGEWAFIVYQNGATGYVLAPLARASSGRLKAEALKRLVRSHPSNAGNLFVAELSDDPAEVGGLCLSPFPDVRSVALRNPAARDEDKVAAALLYPT